MATPLHLVGPAGEARRVPDDVLAAALVGDARATLAYWWVRVPGQGLVIAHADEQPADVQAVQGLTVVLPGPGDPTLDTFAAAVITLADLPGVRTANRQWPWVTHELLVATIDTSKGPVPHTAPLPWPLMQPHNLSVQFEVHDDNQAREVLHMAVKGIVHGVLPAEVQAFVPERHKMMTLAPLHQLWADTVAATAEHLRTGGSHAEPHP